MNLLTLRAFQFVHPDFDSQGEPGMPLSLTGNLSLVEGHAAIRQSILILLSTVPGERVMRPQYGCDLHRLLFSPNDATTAGLAIHFVRRAIEQFERRVEIQELTAGPSASGSSGPPRLQVDLLYRVKATRRTDRITFHMSLAEE